MRAITSKDGRASQASAPRHLHASAGLDAAPFDLERKPLALRTTRRAGAMEPRPDFDGHDGWATVEGLGAMRAITSKTAAL